MRTADFSFELPPELIAQHPATSRDQSRLLVLHRNTGQLEHKTFRNLLDFVRAGDVLVLNNSRVIPARLRGTNLKTGGAFELLLLEENGTNDWWAMMKPGKRAKVGTEIKVTHHAPRITHQEILATVVDTNPEGHRRLQFSGTQNILDDLDSLGELPLPPYIQRDKNNLPVSDRNRYQTVFAQPPGSVAAPTAGLHFTPELLDELRACGVEICFVTLHVGLGTFAPVKAETLDRHVMHEERFEVSEATANVVNKARMENRRVFAVGTTSVRVLESATSQNTGRVGSGPGRTRIFIHPPHTFKIVDALLTNFHLPCSTLLMLASAFAAPGRLSGREMILSSYAEAIRERYRFFSYGDAMLIL
ncbi:MAG: tRNA preQ1(34) S-adenosylmethionine ribosyltransferase-isomerase QueA [Verrucomicrobia bacterium]|nr:tRNA preQ1(34) S-adenosylmethionine ribosyltransferase-isomerase QueA [Verrucomicrobiota bacterium]